MLIDNESHAGSEIFLKLIFSFFFFRFFSVADPGSGPFSTPGSEFRDGKNPDPGSETWDKHLGSDFQEL
jgi:hypothetical protein